MEVGLVQQFSCLGTTDKDVLVAQLQKLIGPQLNATAAQFFLDMNNWNLQLAVGAYFDLTDDLSPNGLNGAHVEGTPYIMSVVDDLSSADDSSIPPYTKFVKVWRIRNSGSHAWPPGSHLRFKSGKRMFVQEKIYLNPPVQPGETRDISVEFLSPPEPGSYDMRWQMSTPEGYFFGEEIWSIVTVAPDVTAGLTERLQSLTCDQDQPSSDNNSMMS
ncbi:unnamed protein product [Allacma fusca]|uniref:Nbr1 FW domain-containing protein n=1 Tax=Allacma fusca TaxID=39272 RepID=A0A8J2PBN0_9HEXA|nr:unnamed protein product [Allacma fusca]